MEIKATITKIHYTVKLAEQLQKIELTDFNINDAPTACLVTDGKASFAISKWVSPKRTRSYPYERVYNTLNISRKVTVIPIVKDEGAAGDRDYIQWDTVSLMSLLDVFVIFAYYDKADKAGQKITNQQFDNDYVLEQINAISTFHSSALHWNLDQLKEKFDGLGTWKIIIYPLLKPEKRENKKFLQKIFCFLSEKTPPRGLLREKK